MYTISSLSLTVRPNILAIISYILYWKYHLFTEYKYTVIQILYIIYIQSIYLSVCLYNTFLFQFNAFNFNNLIIHNQSLLYLFIYLSLIIYLIFIFEFIWYFRLIYFRLFNLTKPFLIVLVSVFVNHNNTGAVIIFSNKLFTKCANYMEILQKRF